jgi:carbon storage regulator
MLVLSRKPNQSIRIGNNINITVVRIKGNTIQLGIDAPKEVHVVRSELLERESSVTPSAPQANVAEQPLLPTASAEKCDASAIVADAPKISLLSTSTDGLAKLPNLSTVH